MTVSPISVSPPLVLAPAVTSPRTGGDRHRLWLSVRILLVALIAPLVFVFATPGRADAYTYGFDWGPGKVGRAHFWVIMNDREALQVAVRTAVGAACTRMLGVPFSGGACSQVIDRAFALVDWRGWTNHGIWIEVGTNLQTRYGRW